MVVYFQTILDYNDSHLFSNEFVLWFNMMIVYFQMTLYYGMMWYLFIFKQLWIMMMVAYLQTNLYCDPMWCSFIFKWIWIMMIFTFLNELVLWSNVMVVYFKTTLDYDDDYFQTNLFCYDLMWWLFIFKWLLVIMMLVYFQMTWQEIIWFFY